MAFHPRLIRHVCGLYIRLLHSLPVFVTSVTQTLHLLTDKKGFRMIRTCFLTGFALLTLGLTASNIVQAQIGYAVGAGGTILKSQDNGATWSPQTSGVSNQLRKVYALTANDVWALGDGATLLHTTNGGANWTSIPSSTTGGISNFWSGAVLDANNVKIVGTSTNNFHYTSNGGTSWSGPTTGYSGANMLATKFLDVNTGWVAGIARDIRKTTDGGATWVSQLSTVGGQDLYAIDATDSQHLWAAGQNHVIYYSTNGGTSWTAISNSVTTRWQGVDFLNNTTGYFIGTLGKIYQSTDGTTISPQTSGTTQDLNDVFFQDTSSGWVVGNAGTLLHTTNGGTNWNATTSGTTNNLLGVTFTTSAVTPEPGSLALCFGLGTGGLALLRRRRRARR